MRYGKVIESGQTAEEFRIDTFLRNIAYNDFGNGGFSKGAIKFLNDNRQEIQDAFVDYDSAYILPASKQFAAELYRVCLGEAFSDPDNSFAEADEVDWIKLGQRYWLCLWWD